MKKQTFTNLVVRSSLVLTLALAIGNLSACAENHSGSGPAAMSQSSGPAGGKMITEDKMLERCQELMKQKQKMMDDMKAQDSELTEHVAKMNSAPKDKKIRLMAAVITRIVEQRTAMHVRMEKMQEMMMQHMLEHMQMGKDSLAQCPMMQGMDAKSMSTKKEQK
jgi:iron-sulfur cluster repair protein YtfE (RIC family)